MSTYTPPTISGYNADPPDDDGTQNRATNGLSWQRHIDEIGDPLNTYADAINNEVDDAFSRLDAENYVSVVDPRYGASASNSGAANSTAIQAAITAVEALGGGVVTIPNVSLAVNGVITITGDYPVMLKGEGWNSIITNGGTGNTITVGTTGTAHSGEVVIQDLKIVGSGSSSHGIQLLRANYARIEHCYISGHGGDGINTQGAYACQIRDNICISNTGNGIKHVALATAGTDYIHTIGNKCHGNTGNGLVIDNTSKASAGGKIIRNDMEGNAIGLQMIAGSSGNSEVWAVKDNYFENQVGKNASIAADGGTGYFRAITIQGNYVGAGSVSAAANAFDMDQISYANILDNIFVTTNLTSTSETSIALWSGNLHSGGAVPTGWSNSYPTVSTLQVRQSDGASCILTMASSQMRSNYPIAAAGGMFPATVNTTPNFQTACGLYAGSGVPSNSYGDNGSFYFRSDGGAGTRLYFKTGGAWTGIL